MAEGHGGVQNVLALGAPITETTQATGGAHPVDSRPNEYKYKTSDVHTPAAGLSAPVDYPRDPVMADITHQPSHTQSHDLEEPTPAIDRLPSHGEGSQGDTSSSGGTLAERGNNNDPMNEKNDYGLGVPEGQIGMKRSAHSSMDHVGELGTQGVSVRRGKEEFAALERRFSNMSQRSQELQRTTTNRSSLRGFVKPSKVVTNQSALSAAEEARRADDEKEEFDLAGTLRSGREKSDEAGIKHKQVGVSWQDLEVIGAGGLKINIRAFPNAIAEQFMMPVLKLLGLFGLKLLAPKPKTILYKNSGLLKPGEMCLVLGRPNAGCSTFLKSIANQRDSYMAVNGDVKYAGVNWKEMKKLYAG